MCVRVSDENLSRAIIFPLPLSNIVEIKTSTSNGLVSCSANNANAMYCNVHQCDLPFDDTFNWLNG